MFLVNEQLRLDFFLRKTGSNIMKNNHNEPPYIEVRGAKVHNLKNINIDVPLHQIVGIAGVSGSGKSSLALGVLYAEGSRRYLESLSTYTRRRMTGAGYEKCGQCDRKISLTWKQSFYIIKDEARIVDEQA